MIGTVLEPDRASTTRCSGGRHRVHPLLAGGDPVGDRVGLVGRDQRVGDLPLDVEVGGDRPGVRAGVAQLDEPLDRGVGQLELGCVLPGRAQRQEAVIARRLRHARRRTARRSAGRSPASAPRSRRIRRTGRRRSHGPSVRSRYSVYAGTAAHSRAISARDLEVELHAVRVAEAECLVGIRRRAGEQHRAVRQVERVAVPLQRRELAGQPLQHRVGRALVGQRDRQHADLGLRPGVDACAEAGGEQLDAEARAPVRHAVAHRVADQRASPRPATGARPRR